MKLFEYKMYESKRTKTYYYFILIAEIFVYSVVILPLVIFLPTFLLFDNFLYTNIGIDIFVSLCLTFYNAKKRKVIYCYQNHIEIVGLFLHKKKINYKDIDCVKQGVFDPYSTKVNTYSGNCFTIFRKINGIAIFFYRPSVPIYYCEKYDEFFMELKSHNNEIKFPCGSVYIGETVTVTVDRPLGCYHPEHKDLYYPINYGYIKGIFADDGEEQDAYILGVNKPVISFTGKVIAIIKRKNDVENKWVVAPENTNFTKEEIIEQTKFQEQYFDIEIIM